MICLTDTGYQSTLEATSEVTLEIIQEFATEPITLVVAKEANFLEQEKRVNR